MRFFLFCFVFSFKNYMKLLAHLAVTEYHTHVRCYKGNWMWGIQETSILFPQISCKSKTILK